MRNIEAQERDRFIESGTVQIPVEGDYIDPPAIIVQWIWRLVGVAAVAVIVDWIVRG